MLKANNNYGIFRKSHLLGFFLHFVSTCSPQSLCHKVTTYCTICVYSTYEIFIIRDTFAIAMYVYRLIYMYSVRILRICHEWWYMRFSFVNVLRCSSRVLAYVSSRYFWFTHYAYYGILLVGVQCSWISWGTSNLRLRPHETAKLWQSMNIGSQE